MLYKTPSGYCTSFASQVRVTRMNQRPKFKVFIQKLLVCFIMCAMLHWLWAMLPSCQQYFPIVSNATQLLAMLRYFNSWFVFYKTVLRHFTISHARLHMIDFNSMQWLYDIARAYCLFFTWISNSSPEIFLSFSVKTSFQQFLSAYTRFIWWFTTYCCCFTWW